jgi:protein SCO1/2
MTLLIAASQVEMVRAQATQPAAETMPATTVPAAKLHLEDAAIVEPPEGTQLPLDMHFVDDSGKSVKLGDYFKSGRPVLLALMYYRCPGLCSELLNQLTQSVPQMQLKAGSQFDVVLISIDPREKPDIAKAKKDSYMDLMGNAAAPGGWHLLTSPDNQVRDLADLIGFGYKLNPVNDQYMHQTAVYIVMPSGKISRVMGNTMVFDPAVLDDSLTNASDGKIGTTILFSWARTCGFVTFNHTTGKYETVARNIMRAGAVLTILALGLTIGTFLYRDGRKRRRIATAV